MADLSGAPPPSSLKFINPFLIRSRELEKADPVISYYCRLYAAEQALAAGVHQTHPDAAQFITALLDNIEEIKNNLSKDERLARLIHDPDPGEEYICNFASRIFIPLEKAIFSHNCTKQTGTSLVAAANFLELEKLFWPEEEEEDEQDEDEHGGGSETKQEIQLRKLEREAEHEQVNNKIKFCKFHAARILKAVRNNTDLNDYELPQEDQPSNIDDQLSDGSDQVVDQNSNHATLPPPPSLPVSRPSRTTSNVSTPTSPLPVVPPSVPSESPNYGQNIPPPTTGYPSQPLPRDLPSKAAAYQAAPQVAVPPSAPPLDIEKYEADAERYAAAQRHAKWAISALNYEDEATALNELKAAILVLEKSISKATI